VYHNSLGKAEVYDQSVYLLQAARQSWQYIESNKFVYILDTLNRKRDIASSVTENYLRGEAWLECFACSETEYVASVISAFNLEGTGRTRSYSEPSSENVGDAHHTNEDSSVLFEAVDFMELPQTVGTQWRSCQSVVWLKRFDNRDSFVRYARSIAFKPFSSLGGGFAKDRELGPLGVGVLEIETGETPHSLVQCRPKALENVCGNHEDTNMRLLEYNSVADCIPFVFLMGANGIGLRQNKCGNSGLKFCQVFLRPVGLEIRIG
jgi:hypothetical protein